jgi:hypothetical protein
MFEINSIGVNRINYVEKQYNLYFSYGIICYSIVILHTYFQYKEISILLVYSLILFLIIAYFLGFLLIDRHGKRHNKTIYKMEFQKNDLIITTAKIFWHNSIKCLIDKNNILVEKYNFQWYGDVTKKKEGLIIEANNIKFYLVKEYFTNYDQIISILLKKNI